MGLILSLDCLSVWLGRIHKLYVHSLWVGCSSKLGDCCYHTRLFSETWSTTSEYQSRVSIQKYIHIIICYVQCHNSSSIVSSRNNAIFQYWLIFVHRVIHDYAKTLFLASQLKSLSSSKLYTTLVVICIILFMYEFGILDSRPPKIWLKSQLGYNANV